MPFIPESKREIRKRGPKPHYQRKWKERSKFFRKKMVWCEVWLLKKNIMEILEQIERMESLIERGQYHIVK